MPTTIRKVLIANRGEIAARIARTCRRLDISVATVHSTADRFGRHVREIGESVELGPPPAAESYLDIEAMVDAAQRVGADAVHPGYGFLSENAAAADAVEEAGLTWIGPRPKTIDAFGDKAKAKVLAVAAGVPVIPGVEGTFTSAPDIAEAVREVGMPVLLKAAAGGGGRGMRLVESLEGLDGVIETAMGEAERSFGSADLMVERYLTDARHIEVQIAGDGDGEVVHLFERECSLQRRHQKIIEEAPAPNLSDDLRQRILDAACRLGRHVSYRSIGTVELIASGDDFYFLEVNPRIQVEHPVTEEITGIDLVELQLRVATGRGLGIDQSDVNQRGHAFEARVYAEDPDQGFLPMVGPIADLHLPEPSDADTGPRIERSVDAGDEVTSHYDPMIAKLVTWGPDRPRALDGLQRALAATHVDGPTTNLPFLRSLAATPAVAAGEYHTKFVEESAIGSANRIEAETVAIGAALWLRTQRAAGDPGPWTNWGSSCGWRLSCGDPEPTMAPVALLTSSENEWPLRTFSVGDDGSLRLMVDELPVDVAMHDTGPDTCVVAVGERSVSVRYRATDDHVFVASSGFEADLDVTPFLATVSSSQSGPGQNLSAPMTGQVLRVEVIVGERVDEGQLVAVMESMKLELPLVAQHAGTVTAVNCAPGSIVERGSVVAEIEPSGEASD